MLEAAVIAVAVEEIASTATTVVRAPRGSRGKTSRRPGKRGTAIRRAFCSFCIAFVLRDHCHSVVYSWMSQISAKNGGSLLFWTLSEKHISEFMLPKLLSSVRIASSFAK